MNARLATRAVGRLDEAEGRRVCREIVEKARAYAKLAGDEAAAILFSGLAREAHQRHARRGVAGRGRL